MILVAEHPVAEHLESTGFQLKLPGTAVTMHRISSMVGEHNEETLEELGLFHNEIRALQDSEFVSSAKLK